MVCIYVKYTFPWPLSDCSCQPMFEREALWISFETESDTKAAVKISVGGAIFFFLCNVEFP
jgi:hypothetical protein